MKIKFILFISFLLFNSLSFAQQISWIKTDFNYSDYNRIFGMAKDHYGNIYVAGSFDHDNFGPEIAGIFLKKYNSLGILVLVDTVKGTGKINSISIDGDYIYVSGYFSYQIIFGSFTLQNNSYEIDGFIVKYDLNGNVIWANQLLGAAGKIKASNNSLYLDGSAILAKYDTSFNLEWIKNVDMWSGYMIDGFDNSIFVIHGDNSGGDSKIEKFDILGNKIWSKYAGMFLWNITADNSGNCYLIGSGSVVKKINSFGNVDWIIHDDSLSWYNATVVDDTLYICGKRRSFSADPSLRKSSVTLYNAITGQFISSYLFDLFPGATEQADFIIKDGDAIYLSGQGGNESDYNFLAKVSLDNTSSIIDHKPVGNQLIINPNPTDGLFQISYFTKRMDKGHLSISDASGKIIFNEIFNGDYSKEVDLSKYSKGIYFVEVISETEKEIKKIVLE